jgi:hypothetical protein
MPPSHGQAADHGGLMANDEQPVVDAATDKLNRAENATRLKSLELDEARQLYDEVCANVRTTDDISFKLLGFVPLVSGVGITVFLSMKASVSLPILIFVGIFGAVVTFGLYRGSSRTSTYVSG